MSIKIKSSLLILLLSSVFGPSMYAGYKPNVILIYTDDHGYTDLGALGIDKHVDTPNMDQLARGGALMTAGYSTAPQCLPSRAGLMTGRIQNEFGLPHNGSDAGTDGHVIVDGLKLIKNNSGRNPRIKAIR